MGKSDVSIVTLARADELNDATKLAEISLLGSILMGQDLIIEDVKRVVKPQDFHDFGWKGGYGDRHARIYEAMTHCTSPHQIAVAQELHRTGRLQEGDCKYLKELVIWCLDYRSYLDWQDYAAAVANYSRERQIADANRKGDLAKVGKLARDGGYKGLRIETPENN